MGKDFTLLACCAPFHIFCDHLLHFGHSSDVRHILSAGRIMIPLLSSFSLSSVGNHDRISGSMLDFLGICCRMKL